MDFKKEAVSGLTWLIDAIHELRETSSALTESSIYNLLHATYQQEQPKSTSSALLLTWLQGQVCFEASIYSQGSATTAVACQCAHNAPFLQLACHAWLSSGQVSSAPCKCILAAHAMLTRADAGQYLPARFSISCYISCYSLSGCLGSDPSHV